MSTPAPLTYDSDRLIREWRERYTERRTVARQMLDQAELLVRDAVALERAQEQRATKAQRAYDLERREREVEQAKRLYEQQVDRLRRELAEARAEIASMSPRQTLMREQRETVADGTIVRIQAPLVPKYDSTAVRPWVLSEIEEVSQRLRMAGGDDRTEVRFKADAIEACVPFPEFALTPAAPVPAERTTSINRDRVLLAATAVSALIAVLILIGTAL